MWGVIRPPRKCPGVILIAVEIPTITYMFLYSAVDFSVYLLYKIFVCVNVWMKAELLLFVSNVTFGLVTEINKYWVNKVLFITKSYKQRDKSWYDSITCIFPSLTMRKFSGQSLMNRGHQVVEQIKCAVINNKMRLGVRNCGKFFSESFRKGLCWKNCYYITRFFCPALQFFPHEPILDNFSTLLMFLEHVLPIIIPVVVLCQ